MVVEECSWRFAVRLSKDAGGLNIADTKFLLNSAGLTCFFFLAERHSQAQERARYDRRAEHEQCGVPTQTFNFQEEASEDSTSVSSGADDS